MFPFSKCYFAIKVKHIFKNNDKKNQIKFYFCKMSFAVISDNKFGKVNTHYKFSSYTDTLASY